MRVAIGHRIAQDSVVFTDEDKIHTPRVNTDRVNLQSTSANHLKSLDHLQIQGVDVPVEVPSRLYQVVGKSGQLFLLQLAVSQCAQDGASTGGT